MSTLVLWPLKVAREVCGLSMRHLQHNTAGLYGDVSHGLSNNPHSVVLANGMKDLRWLKADLA